MAVYEPDILEEFAERLYKDARALTGRYAFAGLFVGGFVGGTIGFGLGFAQTFLQKLTVTPDQVVAASAPFGLGAAFICAVIGLFIGSRAAKHKAFELRFKAQQTLCQVQIEKNTRRDASAESKEMPLYATEGVLQP
jgi:hypothetical protein